MDIKPLDLTVKNLLETAFYKIPRFQRPYSWDRENVEDFWSDAIASDDPDYFIGSFVLYRAKGTPDLLYIVDGQQRLTTITLLLAATRDALSDLGLSSLAAGVQKLIEREDINNDLTFVLDSETPYPYLQEKIQKYGAESYTGAMGPEQQALEAAYIFLRDQIAKVLESVELDATVAEDRRAEVKKKKLLTIRDSVLRLQLIAVQLGNEDDAYLIFETLNTRGKDLTVSDLVKNHLTRLLKPKHKGVDIARDKWTEVLDLFEKSESGINVNRFLHHAWLSRKPYITEKKLFKEIKRSVNQVVAMQFLDELVSDAYLYRQVLEPSSSKWTKEAREIAESIRALNLFRVVQPVPMMLALLREYRDGRITLKQAKNVFQTMENFHVQFTAVTSQRTGGGTAFMYASSARQLLEATRNDDKAEVIKEFIIKLRDRVPSYDEFEAAFVEIRFTDQNTRQRQLVRYLLRRVDEHSRQGMIPDYDRMTIEHIAPQRAPAGALDLEMIGMVGNLVLVDVRINDRLANREFAEKMKILRENDVPLDDVLEKATIWDEAIVVERTRAVSRLCYDKIFRV